MRAFITAGILLICISMGIAAGGAPAQTPGWVELDYSAGGSGSLLGAAGGDVAGVARSSATQAFFFDTGSSAWTSHDLGGARSVLSIAAEGHLVLLLASDLAVVYNGLTGTAHDLAFAGSLLATSGDARSFVCGPELALLVTDERAYVFDAQLDAWQEHVYSPPPGGPSMFSRHEAHADYAVSFLGPSTTGTPVNVAYSLHLHAFAETANGLHRSNLAAAMDHGFAAARSDGESHELVGYSALHGAFDTVHLAVNPLDLMLMNYAGGEVATRTCYAAAHVQAGTGSQECLEMYGFDTRHDGWYHLSHCYEESQREPGSSWRGGGEFCALSYWDLIWDTDDFLVYNGRDHAFSLLPVDGDHDNLGCQLGGTVLIARDEGWAAGEYLMNDWGANAVLDRTDYLESFAGQDFALFTRGADGDDLMTLHLFHGPICGWTTHVTGRTTGDFTGTPYVFTYRTGDAQPELLFYSARRNELHAESVDAAAVYSRSSTEHLGLARTTGQSFVFDAHRGTCEQLAWRLGSIDGWICLGVDDADQAHGYSAATGSWTDHDLGGAGSVIDTGALVGLVRRGAEQHYALYDGYLDCWTPLDAYGSYAGWNAGERTALVRTTMRAYAYGSGVVTPAFLAEAAVDALGGVVEARWRVMGDPDAADFRVVAGHDGARRELPVERLGAGRFRAEDRDPSVARGGRFTYTIDLHTASGWRTLHEQALELAPVRLPTALHGARPNPFNPRTEVRFRLDRAQTARLAVHDLRGRLVRVLADGPLPEGDHVVPWDGRDDRGRGLAAGTYLLRLQTRDRTDTRKVQLVR